MIGVAARNAVLPDALLSGLQDFNAERRFVVHRLQDEADERLRSDVVYRDDILRRLDRIATMGFSINSALTDFLVKSTPLAHEEGTRFRAALKDQLRRRGF